MSQTYAAQQLWESTRSWVPPPRLAFAQVSAQRTGANLGHLAFATSIETTGARHFSRSSPPDNPHRSTPIYGAGGRTFILRENRSRGRQTTRTLSTAFPNSRSRTSP